MKLGNYIKEYSVRNKQLKDIPVYSVTNSVGLTRPEEYFSKTIHSEDLTNYKIAKRNMIIFNPVNIKIGSVVVQDAEDEVLVSPLYTIFEVDETKINPYYIVYFLKSEIGLRKVLANTVGSVRIVLKYSGLCEIDIPVPELEKQNSIVDKINKMNQLINEKQHQLTLFDELVKSRFIELFGDGSYPQIPLIQLIVEGAGLSYGIIVPGDNVEDGVPMVRPSDFNNGELCLDNVYRVAPEIEAKYTRTRLIGNEILVQVIGQPGQIMLSDSRCKGMNVTRNLAVVRPDCNRINRIYLKTYMQSQEAQVFMLGETKQSTLKQLPLSRLKELEIPVPPMELQEEFAAFVKQTDKSKLAITETLKYLEELKESLMAKYFE